MSVFDTIFLTMFSLEIGLKWYHSFLSFWKVCALYLFPRTFSVAVAVVVLIVSLSLSLSLSRSLALSLVLSSSLSFSCPLFVTTIPPPRRPLPAARAGQGGQGCVNASGWLECV